MHIILIVWDATEVIGNCVFSSTAGTHWPFFFSLFHHERLVGWFGFIFCQISLSVLPVHKMWSHHRHFSVYHQTQGCLDETTVAPRSLVADQTPPSVFEWYSKGKVQLKHQWHTTVPYHSITLFHVFCNSFAVLPAPGWCFNSDSQVSTFLHLSLISSSQILLGYKAKVDGFARMPTGFSPFEQHECLYCSLNAVLQILANGISVALMLEAYRILQIIFFLNCIFLLHLSILLSLLI